MDSVIDITGGPCAICGKRPATRLCDGPIRTIRFVGHPPRYLAAYRPDHLLWNIPRVITCDTPMCDVCAVEIVPGVDYCPKCITRIKELSAAKYGRKEKRDG